MINPARTVARPGFNRPFLKVRNNGVGICLRTRRPLGASRERTAHICRHHSTLGKRRAHGSANLLGSLRFAQMLEHHGRRENLSGGVSDVLAGDILRILPGESIPVDGIIISGRTSIDQSVMTGEAIPVDKAEGDEVSSGTVNCFGAFDMKAVKVGEDSSIQRMIRLVQSADAGKARIVGIADRWATWVVIIALAAAAVTWLEGGDLEAIDDTIVNTLATVSGMICDGAKPSCAGKIAVAVSSALLANRMAMAQRTM